MMLSDFNSGVKTSCPQAPKLQMVKLFQKQSYLSHKACGVFISKRGSKGIWWKSYAVSGASILTVREDRSLTAMSSI